MLKQLLKYEFKATKRLYFRAVSGAGAVERGAGGDLPAGTRAGPQHKLPRISK